MSYVDGIGFEPYPYQMEIIEKIRRNIVEEKRMQTVLLPNGGGKTNLSFILSILFSDSGKKVLYYTDSGVEKSFAVKAIRTSADRMKDVDFGSFNNIKSLFSNNYDIVITDAIHALFSSDVLLQFDKAVREASENEINPEMSFAQKSLYGLHYLQKMIERDNSYVISFDLNNIEDIGYAPIIATPNVLTFKMGRDEQINYGTVCADEYEVVSRKKMETVEKMGQNSVEALKFNAVLEKLMFKLDMGFSDNIMDRLDKGFSDMSVKIDNLQSDVNKILSIVDEMNNNVSRNKSIMETYFSIHNEDDIESDLFITRMIDKMIDEMKDSFSFCANQTKYLRYKKLIMVRMGDEAWAKLSSESQKFLITSKLMFMENMDLVDDIDYSGVCLLSSKAFELELAIRIVEGYKNFLSEKGLPESKWPKGIMVYNQKTNSYRKMDMEDYTLGASPYIMGLWGKESDKNYNKKWFERYCKEELFKNGKNVSALISEINQYILNVKDKYRNPAAHKGIISMEEASDCLNYILEVERVLKIMLEIFEY